MSIAMDDKHGPILDVRELRAFARITESFGRNWR
jgi:hypothetical protein